LHCSLVFSCFVLVPRRNWLWHGSHRRRAARCMHERMQTYADVC
jgi:hypothetical protein